MAPTLNLTEELHDECCLAGPGVAHEFDVLRFGLQRYPHHLFGLGGDEADTVAAYRLVELPGGEQDRAFEPTPVLQFLAAADVFADGEWELHKQGEEAEEERKLVDVTEPVAPVDIILEVCVETAINVFLLWAAIENIQSPRLSHRRQCQRNMLAA